MEKIKYYIRTNKNEIFKTDEELFNYVIELEQQVKKQKEVINRAIDKLYCWGEVLDPTFQKEMLDILKEVSE